MLFHISSYHDILLHKLLQSTGLKVSLPALSLMGRSRDILLFHALRGIMEVVLATKAQIEYAQQAYEREKRLYPATLQKAADAKAEMERLNKLIWRKPGRLNGWKFLFIISSQRKVAIDATWSYKAAELRYTLAQRDAEWHADAIRRQDELLQALLREPLEEEKPLKPKNDDERSLERDITDSLYYDEDDDEKNDAGRGGIDI